MATQNITTGFQHVDDSQYQFLVKFLEDVSDNATVLEGFRLQLGLLDIQEGHHILDVGCGIGLQAMEMARLAGAGGKVTGTDISTMMIDIARHRAANTGLPVEFLVADALSQPFPDQSFDRLRTERVLMYIKDTDAVLQEFKRLLKPGGKMIAFDMNWDAFSITHRDKALTRKIIQYASDNFPQGRVGIELLARMKNTGFKDVRLRPSNYYGADSVMTDIARRIYEGILQTGISANVFTNIEIENWWQEINEDQKEGNLFVSFAGFIVVGTKR